MYMYGEFLSLEAYLRNGTGCRTATITAPLLLTSGSVRYEAVGGGYWVQSVCGQSVHGKQSVCAGMAYDT